MWLFYIDLTEWPGSRLYRDTYRYRDIKSPNIGIEDFETKRTGLFWPGGGSDRASYLDRDSVSFFTRSRRRGRGSEAVVGDPDVDPGPPAAGGALPQPPLREAPRHLQLHQVQLPLQRLVLPLALGHLEAHHRVVVVHQLTDLRHRRVGQHLHDGGQLGLEGEAARHGGLPGLVPG